LLKVSSLNCVPSGAQMVQVRLRMIEAGVHQLSRTRQLSREVAYVIEFRPT